MATNIERKESKNARLFAWVISIATIILLAAGLPHAQADKSNSTGFTLTILHTNDLHSHAEPFQERGKSVGGFSRLAHLMRTYRKETKNPLLTIDAGDMFQGTPLFTRYRGEVEVELLNRLGYDLYTIGNHEFDEGAINLADQLSHAKFKILNCNLDATALPELKKLLEKSTVLDLNGEKVGFVGVITPDIESLCMKRDGVILARAAGHGSNSNDPTWLTPISREVEKLKEAGVNKIILISHSGLETDKFMAARLPDVDAIIGGHSHTRMDKPVIIEHGDNTKCWIVQTGSYGRNLGKLDLTFDKAGNVEDSSKYELIHITSAIPEEKDIKAYVDEKEAPLASLRTTVLSQADGDFDNYWRSMKCDSPLGDLITDAFFEAGASEKLDVAMENRGGIRSRIDKGPITLEKIEEILPFDNHLACATVTGSVLLKALEHSVDSGLGGKFLDVHGLKFAYDLEKPPGQRLIFALVEKNGKYKPLEPGESYRIGMTDYSFKGGEGYDFSGARDIAYGPDKLNIPLGKFFKNHPHVKPGKSSRICFVVGSLTALGKKATCNLPGLIEKRVSLYGSTACGVTTVESGAVVPLEAPVLLVPPTELKSFPEAFQKAVKEAGTKYKVLSIVVSGKRAKGDNETPRFMPSPPFNVADTLN